LRALGLAGLGLVIFVAAAVVLWVASWLVASAFLGGSCGEGCDTDVYLGLDVVGAILVVAVVITWLVVRLVARRTRAR
jgi:membrane protein DedA with SNARE-associated domain